MFDSIYSSGTSVLLVFAGVGASLVAGIIAAFLFSLRLRSGKGFFVTVALMAPVVTTAFCFLNVMLETDSTSAITSVAAIMVGMGLIRFRSAQGKAEEMLALFTSVAVGAINGLGYIAYGLIAALLFPLVYAGLSSLNIFSNRRFAKEKLLKITIPESLEYGGAFDETFAHYLKEVEQVGVKTTGMGSMFRLSYRIVMKSDAEEKEMIDELRTKNGNLEISVLPYVEDARSL